MLIMGLQGEIMFQNNRNPLLRIISSLLMIAFVIGCKLPVSLPFLEKESEAEDDPLVVDLRSLQDASSRALEVSFDGGFPQAVSGSIPASGQDALTQAMNYLNAYANFYHLNDPNLSLELQRINEGEQADVIFYQTYQDLPVFGAQLVIHLDGNSVSGTSGNLLHDVQLDIQPVLTRQQAVNIAKQELDAPRGDIHHWQSGINHL